MEQPSRGTARSWLMMAASAMQAEACYAFLLAEEYNEAQDEADAWMSTRTQ